MALPAGTRLGPYEVLAPLGVGGMGEVYKARDTRLNRTVAIKILPTDVATDPQRRERFRREARAISSLSHPHICPLFDIGEADGVDFLVMEHLAGETLAHRLLRGALQLDEVLRIAGQLADALDGAHREGIVHRDLKPANVMLTASGVKVLDFGLAKWTGGSDIAMGSGQMTAHPTMTQIGSIVGTVQYMAPEQVEGKPVDARTDLFALGAIIYEMTTVQKAFEGTSSTSVMAAILTSMPPPMVTLRPVTPPALERVVRKCLAKDPAKRWQAAADLRDALAWVDDDATAHSKPSLSAKPLSVPRSFSLTVLPIVVLALAAAAVRTRWVSTALTPALSEDLELVTSSGNADAPAISPNGKYVAYRQREGDAFALWTRQIDSREKLQIVPPDPLMRAATVTPDGRFVDFLRSGRMTVSGELWRVPLLGGTAKKLINDVASGVGWSLDSQHVAFLRWQAGARLTALLIADGDGSHAREVAVRGGQSSFSLFSVPPTWSPNGRSIAVIGGDSSSGVLKRQVVVVDTSTGAERVMPLQAGDVAGLAWLDNGSLVISTESEAPMQLWRLSYPGGQMSRLTNDLSNYVGVSLTSDRKRLVAGRSDVRASVWVGDGSGTNCEEVVAPAPGLTRTERGRVAWAGERLLYVTTASGRAGIAAVTPERGTEEIRAAAFFPAATADGRTIVFVSAEGAAGAGLWRANADGGHAVQLVPGPRVSSWPVLTGDDRHVIFVSNRNGASGPTSLWIVSLDDDLPATELANVSAYRPDVSRNGKLLLFATGGQLDVCDLPECSAQRKVSTRPGVSVFRWTPDGAGIAYVDGVGDSGDNLWVQPLDGSEPHRLTHFTDNQQITDFAWSRDGKRLAVARATITNDIVLFKGLRR